MEKNIQEGWIKNLDRNEFIGTLRGVLTGEVSPAVVEENVRYYHNYISEEIAKGKTEKEVMELLGDPRLIARTIIDLQGGDRTNASAYADYDASSRYKEEAEQGFHAEINEDGGIDIKYKRFNFNSWYGKLLVGLVIIVVLGIIFTIVGGILAWVLPVVLPVLLVVWLIRIFSDRR